MFAQYRNVPKIISYRKGVPQNRVFKKKGVFDPISTKIKFYFAMAGNTNELCRSVSTLTRTPKIIIQFIFPFFDDRNHSGCPNVISYHYETLLDLDIIALLHPNSTKV